MCDERNETWQPNRARKIAGPRISKDDKNRRGQAQLRSLAESPSTKIAYIRISWYWGIQHSWQTTRRSVGDGSPLGQGCSSSFYEIFSFFIRGWDFVINTLWTHKRESSRLWGTWMTNLVDNPLSIKPCPLTVTPVTCFPKGLEDHNTICNSLRSRDTLEWEQQGC
jgi:hypothetical protein